MAKKTQLKKLATVNVIEMTTGVLQSIRSFKDDSNGNIQAEKTFRALVEQNHEGEVIEEDMQCFLDDGNFTDNNGYELILSHSDTAPESI